MAKEAALRETFAAITSPVTMAALTTAAAFGSLITAFVHPIREFGVLTGLGVMIAMALSLSLIPALLVLWKEPPREEGKKRRGNAGAVLTTLTQWTISHAGKITAGA